jgi:hypothetical protein
MEGDIAGIERCYLGTQRALRERLLSASDVATRIRLSKDSRTYLASRGRHMEPQYETLLAAGRTQWRAGERVRFFKAESGEAVWLPDEADDVSPIADEEEMTEALVELQSPSVPAAALERRDYNVEYYLRLLLQSYAQRLRVAFEAEDFKQLFRLDGQLSLLDRPIGDMQLRWIRCPLPGGR